MIDDGSNASHGIPFALVGDEGLYVGELQGGILFELKGVSYVGMEVGYIVRSLFLQTVGQMHEVVHFSLGCYFMDSQIFHGGKISGLCCEEYVMFFTFRVLFFEG